MPTIATDQEEELLIITDDSEDLNELDIKLEEDTLDVEEVISFDEDSLETDATENKSKLDLGGLDLKEEDSELNLDFDLGEKESELTVEKMLGDKEEEISHSEESVLLVEENTSEANENDIFDFGLEEKTSDEDSMIENETDKILKETELDLSSDISIDDNENLEGNIVEEVISTTGDSSATGGDDDDVNAILNATIAKIIVIKERIESVKEETIGSIAKLNTEIKSLQGEVKTHKSEVKEFDKETARISENVESLEKMKMK